MIAICSSSEEIDLSGSLKELRDVYQLLLDFIQDRERKLCVIEAATVNPSPYDVCLNYLYVWKSNSSIKVSVSVNCLQIEGEPNKLKAFANWFNFRDNTVSNYHGHFDYLGHNGDLIDANSTPLVISVKS